MPQTSVSPAEHISRSILTVRGQRVLLDAELAALDGVATKRLNEQIRRNLDRFPANFMFQLTAEATALRSQFGALKVGHALNRSQFATGSQKHRDPRFPPYAFTEYGVIMAARRCARLGGGLSSRG